jgi:protease I
MKLSMLALSGLLIFQTVSADDIFSPANPSDAPAGMAYNVTQPEVTNPEQFQGKKIAILASHGVQESELTYPYEYLKKRGAEIDIVVPEWTSDRILAVSFLKPTQWVKASETFKTAQAKHYDLVILTGGAWNRDVVRKDVDALKLIKQNFDAGSLIAAVCAGSQVLIDAQLVQGINLTGTGSIKIDLVNAGAIYHDVPAITDGKIITARGPAEILEFMQEIANGLTKE